MDDKYIFRMKENLKKAILETLVLRLLMDKEYYIGEIEKDLNAISAGALQVFFPYAAMTRLLDAGCVQEAKKHGVDGRRRVVYQITPQGILRYHDLKLTYEEFARIVEQVLS